MRYIQSFKTYVTSYNSREVLVGWLCSGPLPFMDVCIVSGVPNIKVALKPDPWSELQVGFVGGGGVTHTKFCTYRVRKMVNMCEVNIRPSFRV